MSKSKIIGWAIASPFILIAAGIAFCEANKAYWDHKVKQWCEKDGGVTVYEYIKLTQEEYQNLGGSYGEIPIPIESHATENSPYVISYKNDVIINGSNPAVWSGEASIIRVSDKKSLSKYIYYARRGGDFPTGIMHESSFSCRNIEGIENNIVKSTIKVKGEQK